MSTPTQTTLRAGAPVDSVLPADVLLSDGTIAVIRRVRPEDRALLTRLDDEIGDDSLRLRFFGTSRRAPVQYLEHVLTVPDVLALVATHAGVAIAMATAEPISPGTAEVAFLVADRWQGRGAGSLLLEHLAALARDVGVQRFVAEVLADNHHMVEVFARAGFTFASHADEGTIHVELQTAASATFLRAADDREFSAESRSLWPLLHPTSVAVYGARRDGSGVGAAVLRSIVTGGFTGPLHVIHPTADTVLDLPAVPSLTFLPDPVDVAIVTVPAARVMDALRDVAEAGTHAAVVISSGFSELGRDGSRMEHELLDFARSHDLRLVGPNCLGLLVNDTVRLNATFSPSTPPAGGLAIATQSGGVAIVLGNLARDSGLGVHTMVSLGNKCDVSSNDLLAAWANDPAVEAVALYLESFGNAAKFARFARRFSERKPLLAVLGGRSSGGQRAGASHTAAAASPSVGVDALFAQAGVIACSAAEDLVETALLLTEQPLPAGPRVALLSNAGGMGVLAADEAERAGLRVPELSRDLRHRIAGHLSGTAGAGNPVDAGASGSATQLAAIAEELLAGDEVDCLVVILVATSITDTRAAAQTVAEARAAYPLKPVVLVPMGGLRLGHHELSRVTTMRTIRSSVQALGRAAAYSAWRSSPHLTADPPDVARSAESRARAAKLFANASADSGWLDASAVQSLLRPYGLAPAGRVACEPDAVLAAAAAEGYPVAAKVALGGVVHRSERGLVRTGIPEASELLRVVAAFDHELGRVDVPVLVQAAVTGVEVGLGVVHDPTFGPLLMVGAGGVATELWADRTFLIPPVSRADVAHALRSLRIWPLLSGFRGSDPVDVESLVDLVVELGRLVEELPEIAELDLNPVVVGVHAVTRVDVKVRLRGFAGLDAGVPRRLRRPTTWSRP